MLCTVGETQGSTTTGISAMSKFVGLGVTHLISFQPMNKLRKHGWIIWRGEMEHQVNPMNKDGHNHCQYVLMTPLVTPLVCPMRVVGHMVLNNTSIVSLCFFFPPPWFEEFI